MAANDGAGMNCFPGLTAAASTGENVAPGQLPGTWTAASEPLTVSARDGAGTKCGCGVAAAACTGEKPRGSGSVAASAAPAICSDAAASIQSRRAGSAATGDWTDDGFEVREGTALAARWALLSADDPLLRAASGVDRPTAAASDGAGRKLRWPGVAAAASTGEKPGGAASDPAVAVLHMKTV